MSFKKYIDDLNATPRKRIYQPIIADYGLRTAICELIDNALDARMSVGRIDILRISIDVDIEQKTIQIIDNASGVPMDELEKLVSPGETTSDGVEGAIGYFGVGSKRAVVALAEDIKISTRFENSNTYRLEVNDEWIGSNDWHLPFYQIDDIQESSTKIDLSRLRLEVNEKTVQLLREHLGVIYGQFIKDGEVEILLDRKPIAYKLFDQWSFPPDKDLQPVMHYREIIDYKTGRKIRFEFTPGLTYETEQIGKDFGLFIYCNRRLITRALKEPEVGFLVPHSDQSLCRVIVNLYGPSDLMPWLSNKSGINYNHHTFKIIRPDIIKVVDQWIKISARLKPDFETRVEPYQEGIISQKRLNLGEPVRLSKLPPVPYRSRSYKDEIILLNKTLGGIKPWTRGLYETMIAEELISRQKTLTQKKRISLILLDSTIEIGCKEYLRNVIKMPPHEIDKKKRHEIHAEVEKHVLKGDELWTRLARYYRFRNTMIHETTDLTVSDETIEEFRKDAKTFLKAACKIQFP